MTHFLLKATMVLSVVALTACTQGSFKSINSAVDSAPSTSTGSAGFDITGSLNLNQDFSNQYLSLNEPISGQCSPSFSYVMIATSALAEPMQAACVDGNFQADMELLPIEGLHTLTVLQRDPSTPQMFLRESVNFFLDFTGPAISISSPADGSSHNMIVNLSGQCEANLPLSITSPVQNLELTCSSQGQFNTQINIDPSNLGLQPLTLTQTDQAGNSSSRSVNVMQDSTQEVPPPVISLLEDDSFLTGFSGLFEVTVECTSGVDIVLSSSNVMFDDGAAADFTVPCNQGRYVDRFRVALNATGTQSLQMTQSNDGGTSQITVQFSKQNLPADQHERFYNQVSNNCLACHNTGNEEWGAFETSEQLLGFVYASQNQGGGGARFPDLANTAPPRNLFSQAASGNFLWRHYLGMGPQPEAMPPDLGLGSSIRNAMSFADFDFVLAYLAQLPQENPAGPVEEENICEDVLPEIPTMAMRTMSNDEIYATLRDLFNIENADALENEVALPFEVSARYSTNMNSTLLPAFFSGSEEIIYPELVRLSENLYSQVNIQRYNSLYQSAAGCSVNNVGSSQQCLNSHLSILLSKAFRQDLNSSSQVVARGRAAFEIYSSSLSAPQAFMKAMSEYIVLNPQFLFHAYRGTTQRDGDSYWLSNREIAHRLSYVLWGSIPDDNMLGVDWRSILSNPNAASARQEILALIQDSRSRLFLRRFLKEWLHIETSLNALLNSSPLASRASEYAEAIERESEEFMRYLIANNRPVSEILTADYTFMNSSLGDFYGLTGLSLGNGFSRVNYSEYPALANRTGLLSQATFLTSGSRSQQPGSIKRGLTLIEDVICYDMGSPSGVGLQLGDIDRRAHTQTALFRMATETPGSSCVGCHSSMNPMSFPFEVFDNFGRHPFALANQNGSLPEYAVYTDIGIESNPNANGSIPKYDTYYLDDRGGQVSYQSIHGISVFGDFNDHQGLINIVASSGAFQPCFNDNLYDYILGAELEKGTSPSSPNRAPSHLAQTCSKQNLLAESSGLLDLIVNQIRSDEFRSVRRD